MKVQLSPHPQLYEDVLTAPKASVGGLLSLSRQDYVKEIYLHGGNEDAQKQGTHSGEYINFSRCHGYGM